ncbi:MAG: DUF1080 domain-containing protein [Phycisphaerae bacterium]|nr:DUF1080 domain-containing protein [Phycisphaerae bacterium]
MRIAELALVVAAALVVAGCHAPPKAPAPAPVTIALFDGATLDGWVPHGGAADFSVEDGAIVGRPRKGERNAFLCTEAAYGDFTLELEFQIDPGFNSGVQFRSSIDAPGDPAKERVVGYQAEIDPTSRGWSAGIYEEGKRGWLAPLATNPDARAAYRPMAWNALRIEARGNEIRTWINGVPAATLVDDAASSGIIALQVHSISPRTDAPAVRWRNIRISPLQPKP